MLDRDDIYLNSKEVAQILDVSPDTVNEFARKHLLARLQAGQTVAVPQARHHVLQAAAAWRHCRLTTESVIDRDRCAESEGFLSLGLL